ncbi:MAG: glycogen synthase GlgA [bacterium]
MNRPLRIAFVTSEIVPYSKTGGLADVSAALPQALAEQGHEVLIFTPRYKSIDIKREKLKQVAAVTGEAIRIGSHQLKFDLLTNGARQAPVYFVDCPKLYEREALYVDPATGLDYPDNDIRFIFFCRAVLRSLELLEFTPDIIHAHDWQAALIPVFLKAEPCKFFEATRSMLTIHNLGYHGMFPAKNAVHLNLPDALFRAMGPLEFWGKINFLKGGLHFADVLTTVSETYAQEIQTTDEFGCGLEGVLRDNREKLHGVVNGVDYSIWSPEADPLIAHNYSLATLAEKALNKRQLMKLAGLSAADLKRPLIGVISRLADQKGFDLIAEITADLFAEDISFVLLGTGDEKYHQLFTALERNYPDKIKAFLAFDNKLAHQIEAGADMFLMPSHYEPCGLNQLYSLRYGTVPIARKTGGLADTIVDYDADRRKSTGFLFAEYQPEALLQTVRRALAAYRNKRSWTALVKRGMKQNFSWDKSAQRYISLYQQMLAD